MKELRFNGKIVEKRFEPSEYYIGDKPFLRTIFEELDIDPYLNDDIKIEVVSLEYIISDNSLIDFEDAKEHEWLRANGYTEVELNYRYSDITGYLWTDEKMVVGGHDIMSILENEEGSYCVMKIMFGEVEEYCEIESESTKRK
jgi:hypothetical protein